MGLLCTHLDITTLVPALCVIEMPSHGMLHGVAQDKQQERRQHRKGHQLACWPPGTQLAGGAGAEGCQGQAQRCVVHALVLQADTGGLQWGHSGVAVGLQWDCSGIAVGLLWGP